MKKKDFFKTNQRFAHSIFFQRTFRSFSTNFNEWFVHFNWFFYLGELSAEDDILKCTSLATEEHQTWIAKPNSTYIVLWPTAVFVAIAVFDDQLLVKQYAILVVEPVGQNQRKSVQTVLYTSERVLSFLFNRAAINSGGNSDFYNKNNKNQSKWTKYFFCNFFFFFFFLFFFFFFFQIIVFFFKFS